MVEYPGLGFVSDALIADLKLAKTMGWMVLEQRTSISGDCQNCGGRGFHRLGFAPGQLTETAEDKERRGTWWHGGKAVSVDRRSYPCPVCNSQNDYERAQALWAMSGLEQAETAYTLEFLAGKGKDEALGAAHVLMAQGPIVCGWITFYGEYGMGKSGILKSLTAAFIRIGVSAHYCRANDMLLKIQDNFGSGPGTQEKILSQYRGYQFLAVDEVDRIGDSAWANSTLMLIMDDRYNCRRRVCTAIATNQNPAQMGGRFEYLASRMLDGEKIPVAGDKLRG